MDLAHVKCEGSFISASELCSGTNSCSYLRDVYKRQAKNRADDMLINAINGEEVDCVLSALSSPLQEELISKNRNVMNARVWLGLGKDGIPVAAKGIGGGRIGQFFMKQIFKKEIEKSKKRGN